MKNLRQAMLVGLLGSALALSLQARAEEPAQTTYDGLQLRPGTKMALVYLKPGADFSGYSRIALLDCTVAFRKNWQREQNQVNRNSVTKADMDRIAKGMSEMFAEEFTEALRAGGKFALADSEAPDVLVLRPAIMDLDITAPDTQEVGRTRIIATSAGQMTLYLEVYDSSTGEILGRIADRQVGRDAGHMQWQNSVTNRAEAKRILGQWAVTLSDGLDALRAAGANATTVEAVGG